MNTGPIIGGTRDGEQNSFDGKYCEIAARIPVQAIGHDTVPTFERFNDEFARFVPFYSRSHDRDIRTGFWVVINDENRRFSEDEEFRIYVLMKLSERYIEDTATIEKRLIDRHRSGRF